MSLFGGLTGRVAELQLDMQMAMMAPIVAGMLADGRVEDEELLQIEAICRTSPVFERNSPIENQRLIMRAARILEDHGLERICRLSAGTLTHAQREAAFTHAGQVVFSDRYLGPLEVEVMECLAAWLGIDEVRARTLLDVVSLLHHQERS